MSGGKQPGAGYETRDANPRPLLVAAIALGVVSFASLWVTRKLEDDLEEGVRERFPAHPLQAQRLGPEPPLLQVATSTDLSVHRGWEEETLSTYGWIDREQGIVRVPIEEAMARIVREARDD